MSDAVALLIRDPELRHALAGRLRQGARTITSLSGPHEVDVALSTPNLGAILIADDLDCDVDELRMNLRQAYPEVRQIALTGTSTGPLRLVIDDQEMVHDDVEALGDWLDQHLRTTELCRLDAHFETAVRDESGEGSELIIRGCNAQVGRILQLVETIAPTDSTVLFEGESGTGKDLFARLIHQKSHRKHSSFVAVNCGAIPSSLIESELFGHAKGAFTGADEAKIGLCVAADGGTLFLDEIGEMPADMQVKLLRVLQSGWVRPVGSTESVKVNLRVIAATNRDLKQEVRQGSFRLDLYYRLNVISVQLPALRNRTEDIPMLVEGIARRLVGDPVPRFSSGVLRVLAGYSWPGNIRELENIVERLLLLHPDGKVEERQVQQHLRDVELVPLAADSDSSETDAAYPDHWTLRELEEAHIRRVLEKFEGNQTQAARSLGINVKTLYNRMKAAGMKREEFLPELA
ncbi:MAG: sigma-54 dependent transcriptional regulator [Planctomycetota bacterium]